MTVKTALSFGVFKTIIRMMSVLPTPLLLCAGQALFYKQGGKAIVPKGNQPRMTGLEQDLLRKNRDSLLDQTKEVLNNYLGESIDEGHEMLWRSGFVNGSIATVGIANKSAKDGDSQLRVLSSLSHEHELMRQELLQDLQKLHESEQEE